MSMTVDRIMHHTFVASDLHLGALVIDLGANAGAFAAAVVGKFGVRCIAYEPNPAMLAKIPVLPGIATRLAAATSIDGVVEFHIDENPEASSLRSDGNRPQQATIAVEGRSLATILADAGDGRVALLKVDIEGAETDFFSAARDADLQRCDQITIEFHELFGWTKVDDIRHFRRRMRALGFRSATLSVRHYGDVLFINEQAFGRVGARLRIGRCVAFKMVRAAREVRSSILDHFGLRRSPASGGAVA